jgi:hypothetical protein
MQNMWSPGLAFRLPLVLSSSDSRLEFTLELPELLSGATYIIQLILCTDFA